MIARRLTHKISYAQHGAALIVSLIILGIMTIIGVTSMQNSGLELKMISSAHDRSVAFEAVEKALLSIEHDLADKPFSSANLYSNCSGSDCFNEQCSSGLCFEGEYYPEDERQHCIVSDASNPNREDFWADATLDIWNNDARHKTLNITGLNTPVKYIIEFLCFSDIGAELGAGYSTQGATADRSENENYAPLYRITAMATGNAKRSTVILQSTFRVIEHANAI